MPLGPRCTSMIAIAFLLGACATASIEERTAACQATDWTSYGENDGLLGVAPDAREKKFADCAELGFPADIAAYQAGRATGLLQYCTVENGYQVGYDGRPYRDACPPELEVAFMQGYEQGRKDRPITIYPSIGFGFGFGSFGSSDVWHRHHYHGRHNRSDGRSSDDAK